jgi:type III restriction enzyme
MKLQYKHQRFQEEAARAVTDCFLGQPCSDGQSNFIVDPGRVDNKTDLKLFKLEGYGNQEILLGNDDIERNIQRIQNEFGLKPIEQLEGPNGWKVNDKGKVEQDNHIEYESGLKTYTFTIEMETGTGKTYTYIKTMYELNRLYGWTKFIVVVPSIAIREGVLKSFQSMEEHFMQEYEKPIQYFVYNSDRLNDIDVFASDPGIHVMIINTQAFNSSFDEDKNQEGRKGNDAARVIFSRPDRFRSRRPIDILAATRPIMIIDEPQSVLGANKANQTRKALALFRPLFKLLYSATHRRDDIYNMVYRLDAMDAYNKHLVKEIEVLGVEQIGTTATNGFVYLERVIVSQDNPVARISFDVLRGNGPKQDSRLVKDGDNLYELSGGMEEYKNNYIVESIDGRDGTIHFVNGLTLAEGQMVGKANEDVLRRVQIRETIRAHITRERELFPKHIKVLSLFFIDHVSSYRVYGEDGSVSKGKYAQMFEEEYPKVLQEYMPYLTDSAYLRYLSDPRNSADNIHQGYFSMDKKGKMVDPSKSEMKNDSSNDESAFDLIMKDKERLLSMKEPVRFIFSHSALKEGWDNPNVFQICTLKESGNENKKRQEVGRGMRLCVNDRGIRQDADTLGEENVFKTNVLTVIASESYDKFAQGLQHEFAEACSDRPVKVTEDLFVGVKYTLPNGDEDTMDQDMADTVQDELIKAGYIKKGQITQKYYDDKREGKLNFGEVDDKKDVIVKVLDSVYNPEKVKPKNSRDKEEAHFDKNKFKEEFLGLWNEINVRSYYTVSFDSQKLIKNAIEQLDKHLSVTEIRVIVASGSMKKIESREQLEAGEAMKQTEKRTVHVSEAVGSGVRYDLIGQLVSRTGLTRRTIIDILKGVDPDKTFAQFKMNPEEFIMKSAKIINSCKAQSVIEHIQYNKLTNTYDQDIFTASTLRGKLGENAMKSKKSLYDLVVVDSKGEMDFATELENNSVVEVYTKLPSGFYINTPMGHYNPDWAVVFKEGEVKHVYFIAETKGSTLDSNLRGVEIAKIECARRHFASISGSDVTYDVVDSYEDLYHKALR